VPSKYLVRREADGSYTTKNLLKRAMRGVVPPQVLSRPKVPFPIPLKEWFHTALRHYNRDVLLSEDARTSGLYDVREVEALLQRHESHPTSETSWQIKNLLFFEMWRQKLVRTTETTV
jgi:asparagine synthase (glutamine-hydrolysing)